MSTELEEQLTESMRREVDGIALGGDVLGRATRRHRRRVTTIRASYALGVIGLAGALAAGLALAGGAPQPGGAPSIEAAQPPSLRLVNAATASGNISYRMRLTTTHLTYEGAFDPRTDTGYVRSPQDDSVTTELLINGTRYMGAEPPLQPLPPDKQGGTHETYSRYGQYPGKHDSLILYAGGDEVLGAVAPDPAGLLKALRKATVTENPDGTLHFEYTDTFKDGSNAVSGDVELDGDKRIAVVTMDNTWRSTAKGRLDTGTGHRKLELFDYGVTVEVQKPKDVVPAN